LKESIDQTTGESKTHRPRRNEMIAWVKQHPLIVLVAAVVTSVWLGWFVIWLRKAITSPTESEMAKFGQFGDTFGSINALFTGLALIGIVYTVLQQQRQLQQKEADSQENRKALAREKREQFLIARLNATAAMLQAQEARAALLGEDDTCGRIESERETRRLSQQLSILLCEAKLGFEIGDWDEGLETLAIRGHVRLYFEELLYRCRLTEVNAYRFDPRSMSREKVELETLCDQIRNGHGSIAGLIESFTARLATFQSSEEAAKHIGDFLAGTVPYL
jgi:hypothetical protein